VKLLLLLFLFSVPPVASQASTPTPEPEKDFHVDCSNMSSKGCTSFNEMIAGKDKDLLVSLRADVAVVCFRSGEDVFFLVDYTLPASSSFKKAKDDALQAPAFVFYSMYKQGVLDAIEVTAGTWTKGTDEMYYRATPGGDSAQASVSDAEIGFGYVFDNLDKTKTTYSVKIRRSTLRFVEDYRWPNNDKDKTSGSGTNSSTGYCKAFK
jgi:hypothetical protein